MQYLIHKELHCNVNSQEQHTVSSQFIAYAAKILANEETSHYCIALYTRNINCIRLN